MGLGGLVLGAVADHSVAMGQVEVECDQRAVLHAQGPQGGAVDLQHTIIVETNELWKKWNEME